jgi:tetratricopeptide (TPR) repeat protein
LVSRRIDVAPADNDGKKPNPSASPLDDFKLSDDEFDWDKALDDWNPTFQSESDVPDHLAGSLPGKVVAPRPAPVSPVLSAAKERKSPPPVNPDDAAPLPPPPAQTAAERSLELLRPPLPEEAPVASLSAPGTAPAAAPSSLSSDDDSYDIEIDAGRSTETPQAAAPAAAAASKPAADPLVGLLEGIDAGIELPFAPPSTARPSQGAAVPTSARPAVQPAQAAAPSEPSGIVELPPPPMLDAGLRLPAPGLDVSSLDVPHVAPTAPRPSEVSSDLDNEPEIEISTSVSPSVPSEAAQAPTSSTEPSGATPQVEIEVPSAAMPSTPHLSAPSLPQAAPQVVPQPSAQVAIEVEVAPARSEAQVAAGGLPQPQPLRNTGTPIAAQRLPLPATDKLPAPVAAALVQPALDTSTRRQLLALLDAEAAQRAEREPQRAASLYNAAAQQAEALREPGDAQERYRSALELVSESRPALRGSRRVLAWPGPMAQPDEAAALLQREIECSSPHEQRGLRLWNSELLRVQGLLSEAQRSFQAGLTTARQAAGKGTGGTATGATVALLGLCDVAMAQNASIELAVALDGLIEQCEEPGTLRAALLVARARLDELAGRDTAAVARYESVFALGSAGRFAAGLGQVRAASRMLRVRKDEPAPLLKAYQALAQASLPRGLRAALWRQIAAHLPAAERTAALETAARDGDEAALADLAALQERAGELAQTAATHARGAEVARDQTLRSLALATAGEAYARAGKLEEARTVLEQAMDAAAATELGYDARSAHLLEQVSRALGRSDELIATWRKQGTAGGAETAHAHVLAARLLAGQEAGAGRAAAIGELRAALAQRPDYPPAVELLVDLLVAAGELGEAAAVLARAASVGAAGDSGEGDEQVARRLGREEAASLWWRAGRPDEAARVLVEETLVPRPAERTAPSLVPAARGFLALLAPQLVGKADVTLSQQVAEVLRATAEATTEPARAAALWYLRGSLLEAGYPKTAPDGGPVEESWSRALAAMPEHGPALLRLHLRALAAPPAALAHSMLAHSLAETGRVLLERAAAAQRPEAVVRALRLAATQEHELQDPAGALATYQKVRGLAKEHPALLGLEDALFVTAWRAGAALPLMERQLDGRPVHEQDPDQRFALLLLSGELLEAQKQPAAAAQRYTQALEIRPGHPVARASLVRAHQSAGRLDELVRLTAAELKEASDVPTRVAAYERQALLATLRDLDPQARSEAIIAAYRGVLNLDANNHSAMRALERHYIAREQWGELIHLYEQMGLTATDTTFAVHIHQDRARLRQRLAWRSQSDEATVANQMENDFRLALYRDRHSRPALRYLLAAALRRGELGPIAELSTNIGELAQSHAAELGPPDSREAIAESLSAGLFHTRAAEAMTQLGRSTDEVIRAYRSALRASPSLLPALRGLLHFAVAQRQFDAVADSAEALAEHLRDVEGRYLHYMLAGVVAQELLKDVARARRAFAAGLALLPAREEAFERLRATYARVSGPDEARAVVQLIESRLGQAEQAGTPAPNEVGLRVELAQLYASSLADRARAKQELRKVLLLAPNQAAALYTLGKLHADDREWSDAVEPLGRYAEIEQRPAQQLAVHLLLGEIYAEHLKDTQQAVLQYTRVLQIQPQNLLALGKLADLFIAQGQQQGALPLFKRLVKYTDDKPKKVGLYKRIAALSEEAGDKRGALEALRAAVDLDPMALVAIGELARYYERQSDEQSLRLHLDLSASRFRPLLRERPRDPAIYQGLLQIFVWRKSSELAAMAAGALTALGAAIPDELKAQLEQLPPRKEPRKEGLRDPALDDALFPQRVAPGFRALFKIAQEPLDRLYGSDSKKLAATGVDPKREKLPRAGHPLRDLANRIAADLGVGEFDIYLTAAQARDEEGRPRPLYFIEPLETPGLVLSNVLVDGASEAERRFYLGGLLKLLQSQLVLPLRLLPDELGVLVGGMVRQFVPDYAPLGFAEKRIINEASRLKRAIPSKLQPLLLPHAMECAAATLDFDGIAEALVLASHFAGLLLCGSLPSAVAALRRKGPDAERQIDDFLRFATSPECADLFRIAAGA